tara:strand:- start:4785 stop:5531 length:747 start_codon:yes stop_codon:yes gene_type:complete
MKRYFVEIMYDGANYHGWQIQPNSITVQEQLQKSISTILNKKISVVGAGRTDAGVHAKQFFAHFDYENNLSDNNFIYKLNSILPNDIYIKSISVVKDNAHSRFDAVSRTYEYIICQSKNPFLIKGAYYLNKPLNLDNMSKATNVLFDFSDFTSFSKLHTQTKTNNCLIKKAYWKQNDDTIVFTIEADRFLRNMVRAIVGTLLDVGINKKTVNDFVEIIKSKDRSKAGISVPAHALYLTKVCYPKSVWL